MGRRGLSGLPGVSGHVNRDGAVACNAIACCEAQQTPR